MRRQDTQTIGRQAEDLAYRLLEERGFRVRNLNDERSNYRLYDLKATKNGRETRVSVKCARANRQFRLGPRERLAQLEDDCVVMVFLPTEKGREIDFDVGYELLIIPGHIARADAIAAHDHYVRTHPGSAAHSVMVKDKVDRNEGTRSGAVFKSWHERFLNAWDRI